MPDQSIMLTAERGQRNDVATCTYI